MSSKSKIPHDVEAEESVIGATLLWPDKVSELAQDLLCEDFYASKHQAIWAAFLKMWDKDGIKPDVITLTHETNLRLGPDSLDPSYLVGLMSNCAGINRQHVEIIQSTRAAREIMATCRETLQEIMDGGDPYDIAENLDHFVSTIGSSGVDPESLTFWELMETADATAPVIIPGMLKRDWRALVVAGEGAGKAVLMRSMAMATAQGIHVMTHAPIEPHRTLYADFENPKEAIVETGEILETHLMRTVADYDETRFRVWHEMGGINIRDRRDRSNFVREIKFQKPELVCIGPLNKFYRKHGRENYEDAAAEVIDILDDLRVKFEFALVVEHHAPKGDMKNRDLVPMGSQRWLGWPELGIALRENELVKTTNDVEFFRKSRLKSNWPDHILRDASYLIAGVWDSGRPDF